ncbi:MAG TPA: energy-coupling factor transporter ATPase [Candidatus Eisenbacteria bacterium]|nr:energy-coupling factor transporter ATPase [Candidatus Eisenbacteria bacterium]
MSAGVETRALTCRYDGRERPALEDVSLRLGAGTLTLVMGATGAGKTTLASCLARIVPCFTPATVSGEVRLGDQLVSDRTVGDLAGTIGMVFQDFEAQLFSTDVTQEVVFGLEQMGVPPARMPERIAAALGAVGLTGFEGRDPTTLSGGEKQRLAIAGLLALEPDILVLDEPTTDLDPVGRREVLGVLDGATARGRTVVLVEHDTVAAERADLVVLLQSGRVIAAGPPALVLGDAKRCETAGVRPPDAARVFAALGLADPPLDVETAADRLRARRLVPVPPTAPDPPPRAREPLVRIEHVTHRYGDGREALRDVSLTVGRGDLLALVGRNGSGKTTLAKHMNGLLAPTDGRVLLAGTDIATLSLEGVAGRVGFVFQDPDHQLFAATVADEVAFGPRNLGLAADEVAARVDEALAAVGLADRSADPFLLDKGARQRLAVASVLAMRPETLVLDEPTTGLDHPEQVRMLELLRALNAAGRTIVIITHTPWVIAEYAERVVLLAQGRIGYDGPVRGFFADPALVAHASFRAPDVTRLGQAFGCTPLTVEELLAWMPRGGRS